MTTQQINANVSHPAYYTTGSIETWDFIADWRMDFLRGNAVKYIVRAGRKDGNSAEQDLRKALEYLKKVQTVGTYPREISWADYDPKIDPVAFAADKDLPAPLAAAIVSITRWDIRGAIHFVSLALENLPAEPEKREHRPPVVYGTDEQKLTDSRTDKRVYEFGKRVGAGR